ncbi:1,6-anhydro-N-acetylmuramyl-L-alanine amidase AmpD [Gilvimarinus agarilyticus]|uniref:1,6-anhydro-N-acetylmuramyl-L-alanine amidase AmpD n=1 Tax=unclassified Gilvimarinus TaxID=2642066 RepID=UPI001C08B83B|nr:MULTISPECIES: 1,6-anhydro-N-acetylmuramyl-L-alanine amidase AmpD [unclassified Gilvimarinus]MBU2885422.1 1,6-anhydro-N-acetylmuramyl-L-alanine amidase AmpD [Gilvimarinus agarilyticus]MDO6570322.1 1,6-anhydro-N-acetylmuramyl-L-alanine amidase AmpD [Gilvimarinus sp. 2_MG-2023]MDO6746891.1 1,6-anhydro-N-acetylmuramyl-L-alanine amidase AmpD [Gilvimarinus sp. 1_MG-2023]
MAQYSIVGGWIDQAERCSCPNFGERPNPQDISLLVIHNISLPPGEYGGGWIDRFFANKLDPAAHPYFSDIANLQVSSHLLIERTGVIKQFVNLEQRAWHAGRSEFNGREECNDFSIGIELEGTDDTPYTDAQYQTLIAVTQAILTCYPAIDKSRILGHSDIAPGRKTDPGPSFDWSRYKIAL